MYIPHCYAAGAKYSCCHLLTTMHQFIVLFKTTRCLCLAVICHLHFWQNDQDLVSATVVTRGVEQRLK